MNKEDLKIIFNQKRLKTERKFNKKGVLKEKVINGFNLTTFDEFYNWFSKEKFEKGCFYCGTTNEMSETLYNMQIDDKRPNATRGGKRGKRLELDRIDPNLPYDNLDNIEWCCYWCNNAKSNFYTKDEFKPIAIEIGKSLKKIIQEHKE